MRSYMMKYSQHETYEHNFREIKLMSDAPSTIDEFPGAAHQRLAASIAELINSSDDGYAIGLQGNWGSGKSTVANIAAENLGQKGKNGRRHAAVFKFDAWANQGDPTRRVFLKCLIKEFKEDLKNSYNNYDKKLKNLKARRRTVYYKESSNATGLAILLYLILPMLPLSVMWLGPFALLDSQGTFQWTSWAIFGIIILITYLLAPFVYWLIRKESLSLPQAFSLVEKKTEDQARTEDVIEPDPTSEEFGHSVAEIARDLKEQGKKLILLVDNIDRLPHDELRTFWAQLRNCLVTGESTTENDLKNVWIIIPFDKDHVNSVFAKEEGNKHSNDDNNSESAIQKKRAFVGFVEKTFRLVLDVPAPLLSDAKGFVTKIIDYVFNDEIDNENKKDIIDVIDALWLRDPENLTPRKLKSVINEIAVYYIAWQQRIPLRHMAIFVAQKNYLKNNLEDVRTGKYPDIRTRSLTSDNNNLTRNLMAMLYGVDPTDAEEILLKRPIEDTLSIGNGEHLKNYSSIRGFHEVLFEVIEGMQVEDNPMQSDLVLNGVNALEHTKVTGLGNACKEWESIAQYIINRKDKDLTVGWTLEEAKSISVLIRNCSSEGVKDLAHAIANCPKHVNDSNQLNVDAKEIVESCEIITSEIDKKLGNEWRKNNIKFSVCGDTNTSGLILLEALKSDHINTNDIIIPIHLNDIVEHESEQFKLLENITEKQCIQFFQVLYNRSSANWENLAQNIAKYITQEKNKRDEKRTYVALFWGLLLRRKYETANFIKKSIQDQLSSGNIQKCPNEMENDQWKQSAVVWMMLAANGDHNNYCGGSQQNQTEKRKAEWKQFYDNLINHEIYRTGMLFNMIEIAQDGNIVLENFENKNTDDLWSTILLHILHEPTRFGLTVNCIIENIKKITSFQQNDYDDNDKEIANYLHNNRKRTISKLKSVNLSETFPDNNSLSFILNIDENISNIVLNKFKSYFDEQDQQLWEEEINKGGKVSNWISALSNNVSEGILPANVAHVLKQKFKDALNKEIKISDQLVNRWLNLEHLLPESQRRSVKNECWNIIIHGQILVKISDALKFLSDDTKLKYITEEEKKSSVFWIRVVCGLIEEATPSSLQWIEDKSDILIKYLKDTDHDTQLHVKQTIDASNINWDEEQYKGINKMFNAIAI